VEGSSDAFCICRWQRRGLRWQRDPQRRNLQQWQLCWWSFRRKKSYPRLKFGLSLSCSNSLESFVGWRVTVVDVEVLEDVDVDVAYGIAVTGTTYLKLDHGEIDILHVFITDPIKLRIRWLSQRVRYKCQSLSRCETCDRHPGKNKRGIDK
jgi:hypothetical protein